MDIGEAFGAFHRTLVSVLEIPLRVQTFLKLATEKKFVKGM